MIDNLLTQLQFQFTNLYDQTPREFESRVISHLINSISLCYMLQDMNIEYDNKILLGDIVPVNDHFVFYDEKIFYLFDYHDTWDLICHFRNYIHNMFYNMNDRDSMEIIIKFICGKSLSLNT